MSMKFKFSVMFKITAITALVVQDAASYEKMAALAEQARQDAKLQAAMEHFRQGGEGIKAADGFAQLAAKYL